MPRLLCNVHHPPPSTLFPYTTLFRSPEVTQLAIEQREATDQATPIVTMTALASTKLKEIIAKQGRRSEEHTSELQSPCNLVCRLLLEKKKERTVPARTGKGMHGTDKT